MTKPIRLSGHVRDRLAHRGVSQDEVIEAIRPIFVEEADEVVVVTVYAYYL